MHEKFQDLLVRIRLARWLRGLSYLVLALVFVFAGIYLVDQGIGLSNNALRLGFLAFAGAGLAVTFFGLVAQLCRRLDAASLAAYIEKQYPELAERLSSTVELNQNREPGHGAEAFISILCEDAVEQTKPLDVARVFPVQPAWCLAFGAAGVMLLAMVAAFLLPGYAHFGGRFFRAWFAPVVGYALEVTPGSAPLALGRPATISARLIQKDPQVALPTTCFLVLQEGSAPPRRVRMNAEGDGFSFAFERLASDVSYYLEAGELVSPIYKLKGIEPVELAQGSPVVQVTPPSYVNPKVHPVQKYPQASDFSALQYSRLRFEFQFTRVPVKVLFVLQKRDAKEKDAESVLELASFENRAIQEIPADVCGTFTGTLVLGAEHGITTRYALPRWKVWADEPPIFTELPRLPASAATLDDPDHARPAAPSDVVHLQTTVEDLVGLDRLEVEYRVNDRPSQIELIARADGQLRLNADHVFKLLGKVKEGDVLRYRRRATDNRKMAANAVLPGVPDRELKPQVVYEPSLKDGKDRWHVLKITSGADPLRKQEILAERDDLQKLIEIIKKKLNAERAQIEQVKLAAHVHPFLSADQIRTLAQARGLNGDIIADLAKVGRKALAAPALEPLAERAFDIAENEMTRSEQHLAKAEEKQLAAEQREQRLVQTDQELVKALSRLEELGKTNERLAQDRLDQMRMEHLAQIQEDLAELAKQMAAQDPAKNPILLQELAKLRAEQDKVAQELRRLTEESRLFKEALQKFRTAQAQKMAEKANDLAQAQRDLADAGQDTLLRELKDKLAELARKQDDLAGRAEKFAQANKAEPAFPEAKQAAANLKQAQVREALQGQQKTEDDLGRLATELDLVAAKLNAKKARDLAREQKALHDAVRKVIEEVLKARGKTPPDERLAKLVQTQAEVAAQAAAVAGQVHQAMGEKNAAGQKATEAAQAAQQASRQAQAGAFERAHAAGQKTAKGLHDLAKEMPAKPANNLDTAQQAKELARRQDTLNEKWQELARDLEAHKAQQAARQKDLENKTDQLMQELLQLSQQASDPKAMHGAKEAAQSAMDAKKAQEKMAMPKDAGKADQNQELAKEAALKLELAAKQTDQASRHMREEMKQEDGDAKAREATGQALKESEKQVEMARKELKEGPNSSAQSAMQKAAQAMQKTAHAAGKQMVQGNTQNTSAKEPKASKTPGQGGSGLLSKHLLPQDLEKYLGKSWGELPGELRTRLVQDLRARYGDDYAPIIQRYFQQIADIPTQGDKKR